MMKYKYLLILLMFSGKLTAQEQIGLSDFQQPGDSWEEVGGIVVNPMDGSFDKVKGEGIFVNIPTKRNEGKDIRTNEEYGDFDLSFEYMMFPGSNSGVYMQGRYEVQLLDSWKHDAVTSADNGGIYERWIEEDEQGYEGHAPRQNASLAPGLWQEMSISFRAPRFDASGKKTENARILSVYLNGVLIQENVELSGPTRGAWDEEAPRGPIRIQGDHGAVAFRNMMITTFDSPLPELTDITYAVYEGLFEDRPDFETLEPVATGNADVITPSVNTVDGPFAVRFLGTLAIPVSGEYQFGALLNGGGGMLIIDGEQVISPAEWNGNGKISLDAGSHALEFIYVKLYNWAATGIGLSVEGPGIRRTSFHDANMNMATTTDPIYVHVPAVHRSFVDIEGGTRLIRAVSVGNEGGLHYTYDMDHGAIVQGWHGEFMDATPMWNERGDGSARPRGAVTMIDGDRLLIGPNIWKSDTTGSGFRPRGYTMETPYSPVFMYDVYGGTVRDKIDVTPGSLNRTLSLSGFSGELSIALATGVAIAEVEKGLYNVDGRFFIQTDQDVNVRDIPGGGQALVSPLGNSINYKIIF